MVLRVSKRGCKMASLVIILLASKILVFLVKSGHI